MYYIVYKTYLQKNLGKYEKHIHLTMSIQVRYILSTSAFCNKDPSAHKWEIISCSNGKNEIY